VPFYLTQSLHTALRQSPERIATIHGERRHSYREFAARVARFAGGLRNIGLQPGDRVGMLSLNSDIFLEYIIGTLWAGGIANPINIRWAEAEILASLDDSGTRLMLVDDMFLPVAEALRLRLGSALQCIYTGTGAPPPGMISYEALLAESPAVDDAFRHGDDPALLLYTGGTTGRPKGVVFSHTNMASAALAMRLASGTGPIYLHAAPMFHMGDIQMMFAHFLGGGTHVALPCFDPLKAIIMIGQERVSDVLLAPTMMNMIISHPEFSKHDLSSLSQLFYGTSPITGALLDRAIQAFPSASFVQGFGMTETAISTMLPAYYHTPAGRAEGKLRSAGRACAHTEIKIIGADGAELPAGQVGEIAIRGPSVMLGYWNKPEETASVLRCGWMHTGDGGYQDEDGFLFIVDRLKDMIVTGGENVYSGEVENAISQHPSVAACAVIAVPDEQWGERVHAVIVLKQEAELNKEELQAHCRRFIAGYKCPRSLEFRNELPLSAAGKVLKSQLRQEARGRN
jgi:acyl-CoA synthetase (AMP-forming)/AMP-acid ligase II